MKRYLSFLFSPHGRVGRGPFWWVYGAQSVVMVALVAIGALLIDADEDPSTFVFAIEVALLVLYMLCALAIMMLGIRRFHDCGKSGWWTLVSFIPFVGGIWYLAAVGGPRGMTSDNRYGAAPARES